MNTSPFLDARENIRKTRHDLPHWDQSCRLQFLTWNLGDALPKKAIDRLVNQRNVWLHRHPKPWSSEEEREYYHRFEDRLDRWLDAGWGEKILADSRCASCMGDVLMFFEGQRTRMDAFVIMPNHVHCLVQLLEGCSLSSLMHSWRGFSAKELNRRLGRQGRVWNRDVWDRIPRSPEHYWRIRNYILENPMKAGLKKENYRVWSRGVPLLETLREEGEGQRRACVPQALGK